MKNYIKSFIFALVAIAFINVAVAHDTGRHCKASKIEQSKFVGVDSKVANIEEMNFTAATSIVAYSIIAESPVKTNVSEKNPAYDIGIGLCSLYRSDNLKTFASIHNKRNLNLILNSNRATLKNRITLTYLNYSWRDAIRQC